MAKRFGQLAKFARKTTKVYENDEEVRIESQGSSSINVVKLQRIQNNMLKIICYIHVFYTKKTFEIL